MKISFFEVILCYIMRYKVTIIGAILTITCILLTSINNIVFVLFVLAAWVFNVWYNGVNLFDCKFSRCGFLKRYMYNKYKAILGFKCALVYDEISMKYHYITIEDEHFYVCNIYLFVIKTYQKEKRLAYEYETRHSGSIIFIASSKKEVAEQFHEFLIIKIRKLHDETRRLNVISDCYSKIEREVEYHKYAN